MSEEKSFSVKLELLENYLFQIDFGDFGDLITDEPEPLGNGEGPNPARLLAASVANCLAASLIFAIRKFKEEPGKVSAEVKGALTRVDGRYRIEKMQVRIQLGTNAESLPHLSRVLEQFEDFCIVTQSVRQGIAVDVEVLDRDGLVLKKS
jgi:uncharacterized OsmC-like protein